LPNDIYSDLDAVSASRQALYAFLSRILERELTVEIIRELHGKSEAIGQLAPLRGLANRKLNDGLDKLGSFVDGSKTESDEETQKLLAAEFSGLFRGGWPNSTHPSESAYAKGKGAKGPQEQVTAVYKSMGLDKASAYEGPDDHIAVELQFMSHMAGETSAAAKSHDRAKALELLKTQDQFLRGHLSKWVGLLAADLNKNAKSALYRGAGLVTAGFVEEDVKTVEDFIDDLAPRSKGAKP